MPIEDLIYKAGHFDWVPLLGPWGGTAYAPLQVGRQLGNNQVVPILKGMEKCDIKYGAGRMESVMTKMYQAWRDLRVMECVYHIPDVTLSYEGWHLKLEKETLQEENESLKALAKGQEKAIKRLLKRSDQREGHLRTMRKRLREPEQSDPSPPRNKRQKN